MVKVVRAWSVVPLVVALWLGAGGRASAQVDLSGEWSNVYHEDAPHRGAGPELGDYTGLPINASARLKAESWDASILSTRERQCVPHVATYAYRGPTSLRIWAEGDVASGEIVAYHFQGSYGRPRTVWMDGRPRPSAYAPHTWAGFSTGQWEGPMLTVTTTHVKTGWIQRNGVPTSDRAEMTEHFIRHDNRLQIVTIINDPIYLDEPLIRTTDLVLNLAGRASAFGVCGPAADEVAAQRKGYVPHYLPGTNENLREFPAAHDVPPGPALGGVATTYPEYQRTLEQGGPALTIPPDDRPGRTSSRPAAASLSASGDPDPSAIELLPVQGNVYLLAGAGGNIAVQVGEDGVLLVDAGVVAMSEPVLARVRELSDGPIRYILNTHMHPDHTGGNEALARTGSKLADNVFTGNFAGGSGQGAAIVAREEVLGALSGPSDQVAAPAGAWPTETYFTAVRELHVNGEPIQMLHQPAAHTGGDSIVYFRRSDVIATGDVYLTTSYPVIDEQNGGTFAGVLDALNQLVDLTIPKDWQEGGTMVIPGHGRIGDEADLVEYRDMVTIIHDRIANMIDKGMTLEQVKAARPTLDYDGRYGSTSGPWTTEMFVEAAYRTIRR